MKFLKKIMVLCAFIAGMGTAGSLMAAGNELPELGGSTAAKSANAYSAKASLARDAVCTRCHDESEKTPILSLYQTKHGVRGDSRTPNCQTCHGESAKHLQGNTDGKGRPSPDVVFKKGVYSVADETTRSNVCLTCHKGTARTNWGGSQHQSNQVACNSCHKVHAPVDKVRDRKTQTEVCFTCHKEQRADTHKISAHPIDAGKVICSDCHNPHGSVAPKLLKKNTVNETCFLCHAEKRGPFLWEHQHATEACTNCHTPHGSNISPLLKSRTPFLCDECHDGPHNSQASYGANVAGIQGGAAAGLVANTTGPTAPGSNQVGRACMNCHVMVHGSNSPAGAFLHR